MKAQTIALAAVLLAVIVAAAIGGSPLAAGVERASVLAEQHREVAAALFVAAYVLAAVLVLPASILTFAAGLLFGLPLGVALTSAGSALGASAAFAVGRFAARDWVAQRVVTRPRRHALVAATGSRGFLLVLLARLSPLIPYNVLNYALSVTSVRFRDYLLATWLGMLPATVLYVYTGSLAKGLAEPTTAAGAPSWAAYSLLALGFVATAVLTLLLARHATRALRECLAAESLPPVAGGAK
jgi:uncharacterized membrane protein YdjX (TVP38/TMEM64 family)